MPDHEHKWMTITVDGKPRNVTCPTCGATYMVDQNPVPVRGLRDAWLAVQAVRGRLQPVHTPERADEIGREWIARLCERHRLTDIDLDAAIHINNNLARRSIQSLMPMQAEGMVSAFDTLLAIHASGFSNGLALGLERYFTGEPTNPNGG